MQSAEVNQFMHDYCKTFKPGNSEAMTKYFCYPATMLMGGMCLQINSAADLVTMLGAGLTALQDQGSANSTIEEIYIHHLANDVAIVSARYHRHKTDGSILEEIAATYTLFYDAEQGIRIVTIVTHDPDKVIVKP